DEDEQALAAQREQWVDEQQRQRDELAELRNELTRQADHLSGVSDADRTSEGVSAGLKVETSNADWLHEEIESAGADSGPQDEAKEEESLKFETPSADAPVNTAELLKRYGGAALFEEQDESSVEPRNDESSSVQNHAQSRLESQPLPPATP